MAILIVFEHTHQQPHLVVNTGHISTCVQTKEQTEQDDKFGAH